MNSDLTEGSVWKNLLSFSLPFLFSYLLQSVYGLADLFIIGQFESTASTTAVSLGSQIMHMVTVVIVGLSMGSTVSIAQAVGERNEGKITKAVGNSISLFLFFAFFLTVILTLSIPLVLDVMSCPREAYEGTYGYLLVCFIGIPFITAYNIIASIYRGLGDSRSPMYFVLFSCVVNIVLDYLFIGALGLDTIGAALATVLSQSMSVLLALLHTRRRRRLCALKFSDLKVSRPVMGKLLAIGMPIAVQDGIIQVAFLTITVIANLRGLYDAAAVGVVEKIISLVFLVPSAMLSSVSAISAQCIGARKHERARETLRSAILVCTLFGLVVSILTQFAADGMVSIFSKDLQVIFLGGQYLRGYIWDCLFAGIHFCFSGYFSALGLSYISFLHNFIAIILARIPLALIASLKYPDNLFPMGLATVFGSILSCCICLIAYLVIRRRKIE